MSIKYYNHKKKTIHELKGMSEYEYANVLRYLHKYNWSKQIIGGEEVWVSSKAKGL